MSEAREERPAALGRLRWLLLGPAAAALLATAALAFDRSGGLLPLLELRRQVAQARDDVAQLEQLREERAALVERLRSDPFEIETVARERHGMVRPGERVLRLESDPD